MTAWLANHFFNPAFVTVGMCLVASPIIIHLINRMRYRRVRFAAMEFLLQSQQRNQRRLLIEQLLLLLLRILIVIGIVLLISRLILDPAQMSVFRGAQSHHVVLIDDSLSMRDRWAETNGFAQAVKVVNQLVTGGAQLPNTQKLTLIRLSEPEQPFFVERNVNEDFVTELASKLDGQTFKCTHQALDLATGLLGAKKLLAGEKGTIQHLHVISDFREHDWQDQKAIASAVEELSTSGVSVNLVRAVPETHANLGITDLSGDIQVASVDVPLRMRVAVKNFSDQVAADVRVSIFDNAEKLPTTVMFEKIDPRTEVTHEFEVRFSTPTTHRLRVSLEPDSLPEDNTRSLAVDVVKSVPVLIVDGDPASEDASYLADAIAADPKATGYSATVENVESLRRRPLDGFACIYLLNVAELPADSVDAVERFVAAGGGLGWFVGDAIKPTFYNEALFRKGTGLFPVPLDSAPRDLPVDPTTSGADLRTARHPMFRIFAGEDNALINLVRIFRFFPTAKEWVRDDQQRKDRVRTLATLRTQDPLFFEHPFGKGRIVTCLTTVQPDWNNWATDNSYVVVQLELVKYLARSDRNPENRFVGEPIALSLDPAEYSETVEILAPGDEGDRTTRLQASPEVIGGDNEASGASSSRPHRFTATFADTDEPGIYTVRLLRQSQVSEDRLIAYNTVPAEGDLELASTAELRRRLGNSQGVTIQEYGQLDWVEGREAGSEIRRWLVTFLFLLMLVEQAFAYRLSYHPPRGNVPTSR